MASTALSVHQRAFRSTVVKKVVMAITGLILIAFLLMHMFGNLKIFLGDTAYNKYAKWLKEDLLTPFLPHGWFIWIFRFVILASLVLHVYCMATLWSTSLKGRGPRYARTKRKEMTLSVRFIRWLGIILGTLLIVHLLMFTIGWVTFGAYEFTPKTPYLMFIGAFKQPLIFLIYAIFVGAVSMHVRHGFWSAFTTLGANVSARARRWLNYLAWLVAGLLFVGFLLPPFSVLIGLV